jgi:hypothetical protein
MSSFRPPSPAYWMWDLNPIRRREPSGKSRMLPCRAGPAGPGARVDLPPTRPRGGYRATRLGRWEFPGSDERAVALAEEAIPLPGERDQP